MTEHQAVGPEVGAGVGAGIEEAIQEAFRRDWGQIVATLIRVTGSWDLAEDCAQEAFAAALERWPRDGIPDRPGAWLTTTARHRAVDRLRRETVGASKLRELAMRSLEDSSQPTAGVEPDWPTDDLLRLMFTCCHPALAFDAQVALTLRTLSGLTTEQIARAFLVGEPTMAKRLTRAKQKIRGAAIPYRVPPAHLLPERTASVLGVLYLMFNEGHDAPATDPARQALSTEAIRLARLLVDLMPDEPESFGLLALLLLHHARATSRRDGSGDVVLLEDQDRTRWDTEEIADGVQLLETALRRHRLGPYQVQAAIAACHATAADAATTDWLQIAALYAELHRLLPSPVVALNRAVAVAMVDGPAAGLLLVDELAASGSLSTYYLLPATRADLLRRLDRLPEALAAYEEALALAPTDVERRFLTARLARVRV